MHICFFTPVKDGMPWITFHYPELCKLPFDWIWHIVEGTASLDPATDLHPWIAPGLSADGTTEYLRNLASVDRRVQVFSRPSWHTKLEMFDYVTALISEPCLFG